MCQENNVELKKCSKCNKEKNITEFNLHKWNNSGRRGFCKDCGLEYSKEYYLKNPKPKTIKYIPQEGFKKCSKCGLEKELFNFSLLHSNKDGLKTKCKNCIKEYRDSNSEKTKYYRDKYSILNKEKVLESKNQYANKNKEIINIKKSEYRKNNREKINKQRKERSIVDSLYKLTESLRSRIRIAFKSSKWKKDINTQKLLGCDYETAMKHIENQFIEDMSWENHGKWHIDHKIPLSSATSEEELINLCHYTNLQPLWATDNISKGGKLEYNLPEKYNKN